MRKTTLYLPDDLKANLEQAALKTGRTEADIVREGIRLALAQLPPPTPTIPLFTSDDPHFAERVDEYLVGFGER
ncbi:MAG: CopG family transcriptional regulator [Dehalococcoidia bacterium]